MYDYNLLVSCSWGTFGMAKKEIADILKRLGDEQPEISKTLARGIVGVKTKLDAREIVKSVRELFDKGEISLQFAVKWVPVDNWTESRMESMKELVEKIKGEIKPGEKWAMEVEKRRYTAYHSAEIIKTLAELITEKVDLDNPDKILRIDILGDNAGISVLKPEDIFSAALGK